jgi:hypothetical protein
MKLQLEELKKRQLPQVEGVEDEAYVYELQNF